MGVFLLYIILAVVLPTSLLRPWIGVCAYYLLAVLGPQHIWWWIFAGIRVSYLVAFATLLGIIFKLLQGDYDLDFLFNKQNFWVLVLWIFIAISYFWGPYVADPRYKIFSPQRLFSDSLKIFFFYFAATLTINTKNRLRIFALILALSCIYLTYWANHQYFSHNWLMFNHGRLQGPRNVFGGSLYKDENTFAMLFVTGIPFVFITPFLLRIKNVIFRIVCWFIALPLSIHAIFLTASRGGLLGLGVVSGLASFLTGKKKAFLIFLPLLFLFYQWQAGGLMKRRSETISHYQKDGAAEQRILAWKGGIRMITAHPFTGVGLGSFITALPDYYDTNPRVAHNTLLQFTAESGLGAGIAYIMIIFSVISVFFQTKRSSYFSEKEEEWFRYLPLVTFCSFMGLVVCSLFLSLNFYEIFFYLLIISNALHLLAEKEKEP